MLDKAGLQGRILSYLVAAGYKPTEYTIQLAVAIAYAVIDEMQANAEVNGGAVPSGGGAITGGKVK